MSKHTKINVNLKSCPTPGRMDFGSELAEMDLTAEEIDRFSKAFKDKKFQDMLRDYAQEISHPENKKKYEEEITLMEQERGMDIKFLHPKPERVLRTSSDGKQTCFINICSNDLIGKPDCRAEKGGDGRVGQQWSLPYSLTPGRPDMDSKGSKYMIYDVIFNPDTLYIAWKNDRFMKLVESTALQGIRDQFGVKLDEKNVKALKMKYKGVPSATVIRKPISGHTEIGKHARPNGQANFPNPYDDSKLQGHQVQGGSKRKVSLQSRSEVPYNQTDLRNTAKPSEPHYSVKYRSYIDLQDYRCCRDCAPDPRPKEIVISIDLPLLNTAEKAHLDVTEKCIVLESLKPAYRLELPLAYPVNADKGKARFDKAKKQLTIILPVLPSASPLKNGCNSTQLVSDVAPEDSSAGSDNMTQPESVRDDEVYASEVSEQSVCHQSDTSVTDSFPTANIYSLPHEEKPVVPFESNGNGFELPVLATEGAEKHSSYSRCSESGCPNDTSAYRDFHCSEAIPSVKCEEATGDWKENFNEEDAADTCHQSSDNAEDGKSNAASAVPYTEGSGEQTGARSQGAEDKETGCELGHESNFAPVSTSVQGQQFHSFLSLDDVTGDQGDEELIIVEESSTTGFSPAAKGGDCMETEQLNGEAQEVDKRTMLNDDDLPFTSQPFPVELREINGDTVAGVVRDHTRSSGITFQNSLLFELD